MCVKLSYVDFPNLAIFIIDYANSVTSIRSNKVSCFKLVYYLVGKDKQLSVKLSFMLWLLSDVNQMYIHTV